MRRQVRLNFAGLAMGLALCCAAMGAAPAPSSYLGVERTIESIRRSWSSPGAPAQPNRPGWDALFDALLGDLKTYATAESDSERQQALDRIYQISNEPGGGRLDACRDPASRDPSSGCSRGYAWRGPGAG